MTYKEFVKTTRICKYCGKEFVPFHPSNQFTCGSADCQRLAHLDYCEASDKSNERRSWKRRTKGTVSCKICNRPLIRQQELGINASCDVVHEACAILEIINTLLIGDTVCQRQRDWMKNHGYSLSELRKDLLSDEYRNLLVY